MKISGRVHLQVVRDGKIVSVSKGPNTVVTAGKNLYSLLMQAASPPAKPTYFGFGSGATAPDISQTALVTEFSGTYARHAFASSISANIITYTTNTTWTSGQTQTLREAGIFTASTSGTMAARFLTSVFSLLSGDVITMSWVLEVG